MKYFFKNHGLPQGVIVCGTKEMSHSDGGAVLAHSAGDDGGQECAHREHRAPHGRQRQRVAHLEPSAHLVHRCVTSVPSAARPVCNT